MKREIRVIGIDDSPFDKWHDKDSLVIGTFFRGGSYLDGVLSTRVQVDGDDSAEKIIELVKKSKFYPQLQAIFVDGIAVAGFNVIDVLRLNAETKIPVIVVIRKYPDIASVERALIKLKKEDKIKLLKNAGPIHPVGRIFIQNIGLPLEKAREIMRITSTHSYIPEPLRVAHIIASGVIKGESKGKA